MSSPGNMFLGDAVSSCVIAAVFGACVILALRYVYYVAFYERIRLFLRRRGQGYEMYTPLIAEESWEGLVSAAIVGLVSWALLAGHNDNCHLTDTTACLRDWPQHRTAPWALHALFLLLLAWHSHCTTKHWVGLGRVQGWDAVLHHAATLALLGLSYTQGLLRIGLLAHWLFVVTNPLLSVSKLMHCLDARLFVVSKKVAFGLFAACYFATRVVLVPLVLLRVTLQELPRMPFDWRLAAVANGGLLLLYGISLFWFGRLLGILFTGKLDASPRLVMRGEARRWQKKL
ncbi:hypothetical protein Agub_g5550 [Astrephomene gubernaculifera]|uniref:TLC domain-containing protein n=1 Tax=Astrephomene gubernaculifera TaxID=47775 RepID=A0AAD3DNG7_9CHLO|nr:hypothetical protein Agub_g5550 [Astrephomene gubernaculifera]